MNTIEKIFTLMDNDQDETETNAAYLDNCFFKATEEQKSALNTAFTALCGYSLDTIINHPKRRDLLNSLKPSKF